MEIAVNYFAVLACGVVTMAIGAMWYGPVFGKAWRKEMGFSTGDMKSMPLTAMQAMAIGFVVALISAYVLAVTLGISRTAFGGLDLAMALQGGFWLWLGFIATTQLGVVLWEGRSWKLFFLNASQTFVTMLAMSAIIALWPPMM